MWRIKWDRINLQHHIDERCERKSTKNTERQEKHNFYATLNLHHYLILNLTTLLCILISCSTLIYLEWKNDQGMEKSIKNYYRVISKDQQSQGTN